MTPNALPAWRPYVPSAANPWTLPKVGHLYRRAGFGATHAELQQGLKDGPETTIERLLKGGSADDDFEKTSEYMASERSLPAGSSAAQLAAWWLYRMLHTPHPLREKLSLFWHNHFATSVVKVQNARYMLGQYRLIYHHALGSFRELLHGMSFDPAMMVWLDTRESKRGKPNENYARELMELFSLGIGHYTEADVREAAKAFTGYAVQQGAMVFAEREHDDGMKKVLGRSGKFAGKDVVDICLDQAASRAVYCREIIPVPDLRTGRPERRCDRGTCRTVSPEWFRHRCLSLDDVALGNVFLAHGLPCQGEVAGRFRRGNDPLSGRERRPAKFS